MSKSKDLPTMLDVAKEAGVAVGTVSKVVNHQPVGTEFRSRVEAAIEKLGYQYNTAGRALRTDSTNIIALIIPNTINPFFALLTHHINIALEKRRYRMLLCFTEYDRNREEEMIQMARTNRVDGIIALTYNPSLKIPEGISFVTIDRFFSSSVPCVASDNFAGGRIAAKKLYSLGCRHIAIMRIGSRLTNEPSKRKDGFVSACVELGVRFEVVEEPDETPRSVFLEKIERFRADPDLPLDGIFFGTDMLAWQMIQDMQKRGISVPKDVQVIGYDGIRMFGDQTPVLSTIVQPVQEIAETCVSTVLSSHMSAMPSLICLPVHYLKGGTTKDDDEEASEIPDGTSHKTPG